MTGNAGERLFEAIGRIPDEMVLEAAQEHLDIGMTDGQNALAAQNAYSEQTEAVQQEAEKAVNTDMDMQPPRTKLLLVKLSGCLKYLPVVACLCIVLGGAGYVVNNFIHMNQSAGFNTSGSYDGSAAGGVSPDAGGAEESADLAMDDAAPDNSDGGADSAQQYDGRESTSGSVPESAAGAADGESNQTALLPIRYDAYDGPVFPLTATGDTQKLKVSRSLRGTITSEGEGADAQPLLHVADHYKIGNTAREDKTLQLVYPFVTTLNRAFSMNGEILRIEGEEQMPVIYSIGNSISAYRNADPSEAASMQDYQQIFQGQTEYQEQALAKEADWNQEVRVYTFSDILIEDGADANAGSGVIGVTVKGDKAEVLTYGFDHSFKTEEGSFHHCFFLPQEEKKLLLIVTGEQEGEPELGYYTNLDCEEPMDGIQCEMNSQTMTYADALRLCSSDAARKLRQAYEQGMYDAELPEYMNEDAAFAALTMVSDEEAFYDMLVQRYQSVELSEILERLFGETRVVYAMTTVTIPAKQSIQAKVQALKRQNTGNYMLAAEKAAGKDAQYEFLPASQSHLQIANTGFRLLLEDGWQLADQDLGLVKKREGVWKADLQNKAYYFTVTRDDVQMPAD